MPLVYDKLPLLRAHATECGDLCEAPQGRNTLQSQRIRLVWTYSSAPNLWVYLRRQADQFLSVTGHLWAHNWANYACHGYHETAP